MLFRSMSLSRSLLRICQLSLKHESSRIFQCARVSCISQPRFYSGKPPSDKDKDLDIEKELKDLNEKLKKDFDKTVKDEDVKIDPKFMNFSRMQERKLHERSGIFNWKIAIGTLVIGGTCLIALLYVRKIRLDERERQRKITAGKARIGGEWELVNMQGKPEGSQELRGNWLLMYFGFTHCPDICPDEIEKMIKVIDTLDKKVPPIPIIPVFISVDPARDTMPRIKQYCEEFSPKLRGYTGTPEQIGKVTKTFRVYHSQGPETAPGDYIVDHTVIMYLIDPDGNFHDYYGQNRKADEIANIIEMKVLKHEAQKRKKGTILGL